MIIFCVLVQFWLICKRIHTGTHWLHFSFLYLLSPLACLHTPHPSSNTLFLLLLSAFVVTDCFCCQWLLLLFLLSLTAFVVVDYWCAVKQCYSWKVKSEVKDELMLVCACKYACLVQLKKLRATSLSGVKHCHSNSQIFHTNTYQALFRWPSHRIHYRILSMDTCATPRGHCSRPLQSNTGDT